MKRFICYGGDVISNSDGQKHYIKATRVAELWKVSQSECFFVNPSDNESLMLSGYNELYIKLLIPLRPNYLGFYNLDNYLWNEHYKRKQISINISISLNNPNEDVTEAYVKKIEKLIKEKVEYKDDYFNFDRVLGVSYEIINH